MLRFSEDFIWYGKEFQTFGPRYLKLCFQIFFDSILEFLDSVYIFLLLEIHHCKWENVFYEARISIIVSFENFNSQTTIVRNIHGAFHWPFN